MGISIPSEPGHPGAGSFAPVQMIGARPREPGNHYRRPDVRPLVESPPPVAASAQGCIEAFDLGDSGRETPMHR